MITPEEIAIDTQKLVDEFANSMTPIQKALYDKIIAMLKSLDVDSEGNIKFTTNNLKIMEKVKSELKSVINNPKFKNNVADINSDLQDINEMQQKYFDDVFKVSEIPIVLKQLKDISFKDTVETLTSAGMQENVINAAADIVKIGVTESQSFGDMISQLKTFMIGDKDVPGRLVSYSKQVISDIYHTQSRVYNQTMVEKLGLVWYQYVGSTKDTSRPICISLVDYEWIHQSELGGIAHGIVNGQQISTQGMMKDTTKENIVARCGGYNCNHHMVPVPPEAVPKKRRAKFEGVEDLTEKRPKYK